MKTEAFTMVPKWYRNKALGSVVRLSSLSSPKFQGQPPTILGTVCSIEKAQSWGFLHESLLPGTIPWLGSKTVISQSDCNMLTCCNQNWNTLYNLQATTARYAIANSQLAVKRIWILVQRHHQIVCRGVLCQASTPKWCSTTQRVPRPKGNRLSSHLSTVKHHSPAQRNRRICLPCGWTQANPHSFFNATPKHPKDNFLASILTFRLKRAETLEKITPDLTCVSMYKAIQYCQEWSHSEPVSQRFACLSTNQPIDPRGSSTTQGPKCNMGVWSTQLQDLRCLGVLGHNWTVFRPLVRCSSFLRAAQLDTSGGSVKLMHFAASATCEANT